MRNKPLIVSLIMMMAITACALPFGNANSDENPDVADADLTPTVEVTPSPTATETSIPIAPTLGSAPTQSSEQPTATPATAEATAEATAATNVTATPTVAATSGGATTPVVPENNSDGISINPQLSEPGVDITVEGDGFSAGQSVPLSWAFEALGSGVQFDTVVTNADGSFRTSVTVPESKDWPGGSAEEGEAIYLQAVDTSKGIVYWAQFKYVPLFNPEDPVQTFSNPDEGYTIMVPDGWSWTWNEEDTFNVRFDAPTDVGGGFIRAYSSTNTDNVISTVMAAEFAGQNYTVSTASVGKYPGKQAVTDNGKTVFFYTNSSSGKTYAVYLVNSSGTVPNAVIGTFTFLE